MLKECPQEVSEFINSKVTSQSHWSWYRAVSKKVSWPLSWVLIGNESKLQANTRARWILSPVCTSIHMNTFIHASKVLFCVLINPTMFPSLSRWCTKNRMSLSPYTQTYLDNEIYICLIIYSQPWLNRYYPSTLGDIFLLKIPPTKLDSHLDYHAFLTAT